MTLQYFLKNTISNYTVLILKIILSILTLPVCLKVYGEDVYGIYLLSLGLSASLAFLDLGSGKSLFRFAAEYKVDKDFDKLQKIFSANISLNLISCVFIFSILCIAGIFSSSLFHIPEHLRNTTRTLFMLSACNAVFVFLDYIPANLLSGLSLFHRRNKLQLIPIACNFIILFYIWRNRDLPIITFAICTVAVSFIATLLDYLLLQKETLLQKLYYKPIFRIQDFKNEYSGYTTRIFIISAIGFLGIQADRLIISGVSTVTQVTMYTIITRPYFLIKGLFANIYSVLQPALVHAKVENDTLKLHTIIQKFTTGSFLIILCIAALISIYFENILQFWLGTDKYNVYSLWGILALANICIPALYGPLARILLLSDNVQFLVRTNTILIVLNAAVSILLTIYLGFPGVIIGTTVQMILEYFLITIYGARKINFNSASIYKNTFVVSFIFMLIIALASRYFFNNTSLPSFTLHLVLVCIILLFTGLITLYFRKEKILSLFST